MVNDQSDDEPRAWTVLSHGLDAMIEAGVSFSSYPRYVLEDLLEEGGRRRIKDLALNRDDPGSLKVQDMMVLIEQVAQEQERPGDQRPATRSEQRRKRDRLFPVLDGLEDFPQPRSQLDGFPAPVAVVDGPSGDAEAIDPPAVKAVARVDAALLRIEHLLVQWRHHSLGTEEAWEAVQEIVADTPRGSPSGED